MIPARPSPIVASLRAITARHHLLPSSSTSVLPVVSHSLEPSLVRTSKGALVKGVDVNLKDKILGSTPLHLAAANASAAGACEPSSCVGFSCLPDWS